MQRSIVIFTSTLSLIGFGCSTDTTGVSPPDLPHSPVDSAWKAVENLDYAYNTMDLNLVNMTLSEDFTHQFAVGSPPGIVWDRAQEMEWFADLFEVFSAIDMTFSGSAEWPWSGDSTGQSLELPRAFNVIAYYQSSSGPYEGRIASGNEQYICRPDSDDEWHIWYQVSAQENWWP